MNRITREKKTVTLMIRRYCRKHHEDSTDLCPRCAELLAYSLNRLEKCRYGVRKPTCAHCPVHCYRPDMREEIRKVMRYSGPRLLLKHPILAVMHLVDGFRHR